MAAGWSKAEYKQAVMTSDNNLIIAALTEELQEKLGTKYKSINIQLGYSPKNYYIRLISFNNKEMHILLTLDHFIFLGFKPPIDNINLHDPKLLEKIITISTEETQNNNSTQTTKY